MATGITGPFSGSSGPFVGSSGYGSHMTHAAPYRSAESVTSVVLTPEQHAKTMTVECGGRAYTYDAHGNHIGTDVEVTAARMPTPADTQAITDVAVRALAAARGGIFNPATGNLHDPVTLAPLSPAADATFEAWESLPASDPRTIEEYAAEPLTEPDPIPARSSAWHRGLAKVRALVPR